MKGIKVAIVGGCAGIRLDVSKSVINIIVPHAISNGMATTPLPATNQDWCPAYDLIPNCSNSVELLKSRNKSDRKRNRANRWR